MDPPSSIKGRKARDKSATQQFFKLATRESLRWSTIISHQTSYRTPKVTGVEPALAATVRLPTMSAGNLDLGSIGRCCWVRW